MNISDLVVNGWRSEIARASQGDPELRVRVSRVIEATRHLHKATCAELSSAIEEQNLSIDELKRYVCTDNQARQADARARVLTETS